MKKAFLSMALVLVVLLAAIPTLSAQAPSPTPPTWKPVPVYKTVEDSVIRPFQTTRFFVRVYNNSATTWNSLVVSDNVNSVFLILGAVCEDSSLGTLPTTIVGQTVTCSKPTLVPGDYFILTITVKLNSYFVPGPVTNKATLSYSTADGTPGFYESDPATVNAVDDTPPTVPEASTLVLLGSAVTGLAGYVGLQVRARRRREK